MTQESDYYKVLEYLAQYQNDSDYYDIDVLLGEDKSYRYSEHYQRVIQRLGIDRLIELKTGSGGRGLPPTRGSGKKAESYDSSYRPLLARITLVGLERYEEINRKELENKVKKDAPTSNLQKRILIIGIISLLFAVLRYVVVTFF